MWKKLVKDNKKGLYNEVNELVYFDESVIKKQDELK